VAAIAVAAYALVRVLAWSARVELDRWWLDDLTDAPVWSTRTAAQLQLGIGAAVVTAAVLGVANHLALRGAPVDSRPLPGPLAFAAGRLGPALAWLAYGIPLLLAWRVGWAATDQWQAWLLYRHGGRLGVTAPGIGWDVGFHLFALPFLQVLFGWLLQLVAVAVVSVVVIGVLRGTLRPRRGDGAGSAPSVVRLVCVLASVWFLVLAASYVWVRRPALATNRAGAFDGPGYAELNGPGAAYRVLPLVCVAAAAALVWAGWRRRWRWPAALVLTWAAAHVATVWVLPVALRQFVVAPAEARRELPAIARNIDATRTAYGFADVREIDVTAGEGAVTASSPDADPAPPVPLFDTGQLVSAFQVLQGRTATRITDVDLDRYELDGTLRPVIVATRDASRADLPERGWVQDHLVYTHGDGLVASLADTTTDAGGLVFDGLERTLGLRRDAVYFGEGLRDWYVVVSTRRAEVGGVSYEGGSGVSIGSPWRRLVAGVALGEYEPVVSAELTGDSVLLFRRDLRERVGALAPFLAIDSDPYPVVADGRVVWVVEAYTTSSSYPYAQFADTGGLPAASDLAGAAVNAVRGSVTATVDATDGTVHLYRTDLASGTPDPVLDAWDGIFPGLLEPVDALPGSIRAHLRYPADLFALQSALLGRYRITDPETVFNGSAAWSVAVSPGADAEDTATGPAPVVHQFVDVDGSGTPVSSGAVAAAWSAVRPYSPGSAPNPASARDELAGFALADHATRRLSVVTVHPADDRQLTSPRVAQSVIAADPDLSRQFTLLNANGSKVRFGPMTLLLREGRLAWIRPVLVTSTAPAATPRLFTVLAVSGGRVASGPTAAEALAGLDGG
jgi:hypothetical protein